MTDYQRLTVEKRQTHFIRKITTKKIMPIRKMKAVAPVATDFHVSGKVKTTLNQI